MSSISSNLQAVNERITNAARDASRDRGGIRLLAVSKTFGAEAVIEAAACGQNAFGENYLQEALDKMAVVKAQRPDLLLEWHFIGPIQSNKTRPIAEHFDWVHSVDREKIAQRLSEQRPAHLPPLNICLQVNISGEASKSGAMPAEAPVLAQRIAGLPRLKLRGLMAIPEPAQDEEAQRAPHRRLRQLAEEIKGQGIELDTLSMGMSADLAAAVAEGATIVRIGTAIFGQRHYG
ncbi:YggS family pyridoxal phosphate-dependent enzyme [Noviherbaspirillum sp. CPCC 100848]|uniref:Pyridoxal phosphate homeostasis protein n=1 Tax=Noviherbaspirillum album TaxID=3080276 RepID=A0ABU6J9Y9_9BURK|nr:YggS family pyridoxal phosphate-dependent enzyme [Noviherbaspirillum sp. CPCC 100848]MEC4720243.1 YggS family pyridoxal phosphate-dependent enzyme [Noviherbaspirillum sp. CPCC 100848]